MLILGRQEYQTGGNLHFSAKNDRQSYLWVNLFAAVFLTNHMCQQKDIISISINLDVTVGRHKKQWRVRDC